MVSSSPPTASAESTSRRKSGRIVQKPELYQPDSSTPARSNGSSKRKRAGEAIDDEDEDELEESEDDEQDSDPDEEELKERRRAAKVKPTKSKPAAKKPKPTVGKTIDLAMRPATNGVRKVTKGKKLRIIASAEEGVDHGALYRESLCSSIP